MVHTMDDSVKIAQSDSVSHNEVSLVSLAMLMVRAEESHEDYLDYLSPFLIEVIRRDGSRGINRNTAQSALLQHFGLTVPTQTIELCLKRLAKRQLLTSSRLYGLFTYTPRR